jgi:hypothetical protein
LFKPKIETLSFLEEIINCSIEVFTGFESNIAVRTGKLGNLTGMMAESTTIVQKNPRF